MNSFTTLIFTAVALTALACAQEGKPEAARAEEKDLSGAWNGDAGGEKEWGEIKLKSTEDGYIGTYSDTFNRQLGSLTFKRVGERRYKGLWWESSLKHYGSFELEASQDGRTITVNWKALDGRTKSARSTWKPKGE
jgi:hypothetical protein